MAAQRDIKSPEEFADAVRGLARADNARLRQLAIGLAAFGSIEAEDLLQEAIKRGIAGSRRWPRDISIIKFLAMTMRSIVDGENKRARRRPGSFEDDEDPDIIDVNPYGLGTRSDDILISEEEKGNLLSFFSDDPIAQLIVEGMIDGMEGEDLRSFVGLDQTAYNSKRRQIRRTINRKFGLEKKDEKVASKQGGLSGYVDR